MITKCMYYAVTMLLNRILGLLPLRQRQVLFLSDVRGSLSGNFKYVYEQIAGDYEIRMSLKADRRLRRGLRDYLRMCVWLATSEVIFLDDYCDCTAYMHVRRGQELVQLWHGSGAYKKFGYSRSGADAPRHIHAGYRRYTKALVSSEAVRSCYAEAFGIPVGRVLATGVPRTDLFFDAAYQEKARQRFFGRFPQIAGRKVILFAPTYRGTRVADAAYDFDRLDLREFYEALHEEYVLLVKWHPALWNNILSGRAKGWDSQNYPDFVLDVSEEREVNELLFAADLLITDYSSLIFDWALCKKPVIYFTYDLKTYAGGRGLYFPFTDYVYGETAADTRSLIAAVRRARTDEEKRSAFVRRFAEANDGHAAERAVRAVFGERRQEIWQQSL